jgi:hypothetical protein
MRPKTANFVKSEGVFTLVLAVAAMFRKPIIKEKVRILRLRQGISLTR